MKKIIMTAALAVASFGAAIAAGDLAVTNNGTLGVTVNDYLTVVPSGGFAAGPVIFSTPDQQVTPWTTSNTVTVVASRAWKYEYSATNFVGGSNGTGVSSNVPVGNIWHVGTSAGSANVNVTGSNAPASNTLQNIANQSTGTQSSTFVLTGVLTPGLNNQMSGTYSSTITQIASLD